jgi:4-hydroxybenzoate polyprenyltransferase
MLSAFRFAYWIGLILILALLVFEHILARRRDPISINAAFFKLNATISVILLVVVAVEIVFPWFRLRWY